MRLPLLLAFGLSPLAVHAASPPAPPANAALWVTQLGDSGPGSLRAAIEAANARPGLDHIRFARTLDGVLPVLGDALLIRDALYIHGPGSDRIRLRGDGENRIIQVAAQAGEVTVTGLHLSNAGDSAVVNEGALLTVTSSTLRANFGRRGAAIASYGGALYLNGTTISDNYSESLGGTDDGVGGGVYARDTTVMIEASRVSSNHADTLGGGLYVELGEEDVLMVRGSLIDANAAVTQGGGAFVHMHGDPASAFINSTLSGNRAPRHAAVWFDGGLVIGNSTIADNYSPLADAPGVCPGLCGAGARSELWLTSTLISANRDVHGNGYDLAPMAGPVHVTHSLIERVADGTIDDDRGGNLLNIDPRLGPLTDQQGQFPVHALAADSPAIDTGSNPSLLQHDQRGSCHARVVGAAADIGAYEHAPAPTAAATHRRLPSCWPLPARR